MMMLLYVPIIEVIDSTTKEDIFLELFLFIDVFRVLLLHYCVVPTADFPTEGEESGIMAIAAVSTSSLSGSPP